MATHSSTLAWKIPWAEEPGRLQSMGSQRVGYDWATLLTYHVPTTWSTTGYWRHMSSVSGRPEPHIGHLFNEAFLCHIDIFWLRGLDLEQNQQLPFKNTFSTMQSFFQPFFTARAVVWVDLKGKTEVESYFWKAENHNSNVGNRLAAEGNLRLASYSTGFYFTVTSTEPCEISVFCMVKTQSFIVTSQTLVLGVPESFCNGVSGISTLLPSCKLSSLSHWAPQYFSSVSQYGESGLTTNLNEITKGSSGMKWSALSACSQMITATTGTSKWQNQLAFQMPLMSQFWI